ncbi:MAG: hypothetical protein D4R64_02430 [Porphyromonadaceae bacterium]|nr:MAG: hypothetical protein D4R64_02430 [Porphyromonadaceae bacterium]
MNSLEDFIKENKEMFMNNEPPEGHFERFELRLKQMQRRNKIRFITRISSIAAIGLLLITSSIFIYDRYFDREPVLINLGDLNPQMQKVEYYYTSQIDQLSVGIDSLSAETQENIKKMMSNELAEMESIHRELQQKLGSNPGDERVVNAMITYYQTKLGMMKSFLQTLTQIKQTNNSKKVNHENTLL